MFKKFQSEYDRTKISVPNFNTTPLIAQNQLKEFKNFDLIEQLSNEEDSDSSSEKPLPVPVMSRLKALSSNTNQGSKYAASTNSQSSPVISVAPSTQKPPLASYLSPSKSELPDIATQKMKLGSPMSMAKSKLFNKSISNKKLVRGKKKTVRLMYIIDKQVHFKHLLTFYIYIKLYRSMESQQR